MEITSLKFVLLTLISITSYYLVSDKFKNLFLLLVSAFFVGSISYILLIYVFLYSLFNYSLGIILTYSKRRTLFYKIGIFFNLAQLIVLKYSVFAIDPLLSLFGLDAKISVISYFLIPIGISYFTLQGLGYLVNIRMGWEKPERSFVKHSLYVLFYPKFLSGPIERSNHFFPQLGVKPKFNEREVTDGLRMALFGFFKKIAIANQLAPLVTDIYANIDSLTPVTVFLLIIIQPLYLYFDFSGYTDIALGISKAFGIQLVPNFNRPFFAENVTTFWKRFHISLSAWFNDYVFRQLSFKYRKWGIYASILSVFITWTLFGIWHGAGWTFMVLGLLQAVAITYEFITKKWRIKLFSNIHPSLVKWVGRSTTYLFYGISLLFFFSPDLSTVFHLLEQLVNFRNWELRIPSVFQVNTIMLDEIVFMAICLLLELFREDKVVIANRLFAFWEGRGFVSKASRWLLYYLIILILLHFSGREEQFIYFQF